MSRADVSVTRARPRRPRRCRRRWESISPTCTGTSWDTCNTYPAMRTEHFSAFNTRRKRVHVCRSYFSSATPRDNRITPLLELHAANLGDRAGNFRS